MCIAPGSRLFSRTAWASVVVHRCRRGAVNTLRQEIRTVMINITPPTVLTGREAVVCVWVCVCV